MTPGSSLVLWGHKANLWLLHNLEKPWYITDLLYQWFLLLVLGGEADAAGSCGTEAADWQEASAQNLRHSKAPGKSYNSSLVLCPGVFTHWTRWFHSQHISLFFIFFILYTDLQCSRPTTRHHPSRCLIAISIATSVDSWPINYVIHSQCINNFYTYPQLYCA